MKVLINGAAGRMGKEVVKLCEEGFASSSVAAKIDKIGGEYLSLDAFSGEADVIVDFSHHTCASEVCDYAVKRNIPVVIATTGHTEEEKAIIKSAAEKTAIFYSGNMSVGIAVLRKLVKAAVAAFPSANVEIVETHHNRKLDAPSGTALMLADSVKAVRPDAYEVYGREGQSKRDPNEIGMHSLRYGNIVGIHEVFISTDAETITLKHEAHSRAVFAEGALVAAGYMVGKKSGLYSMEDLLRDKE